MPGGIVFIHPSDELYGADRMLLRLLEALPDEVPVQVWLPRDLPHGRVTLCAELERRGVRVRHLELPILRRAYQNPRGLVGLGARALGLLKVLRQERPETVYCTTSATFLTAPLARLAGVGRVVGHVQEMWSRSDRWVLLPAALACHRLLTISAAVRAALPSLVGRHVRVVENATPPPTTVIPPPVAGPLRFVVASRWNGWKGHRTLLRAWDRLEDPGRLVVLGGPPPSGESVDVVGLVERLRHPRSVEIVGDVPDPGPYLDAADVVLVPSDDPEPFGLVAIEAFARHRPVVASRAGGVAEVVTDGETGWLFPPRDDAALADVLAALTRDAARVAGEAAGRRYDEQYTPQAYSDRWLAASGLGVLRGVLGGGHGGLPDHAGPGRERPDDAA